MGQTERTGSKIAARGALALITVIVVSVGVYSLSVARISVTGSMWPFWHGGHTVVLLLIVGVLCWLAVVAAVVVAAFLSIAWLWKKADLD